MYIVLLNKQIIAICKFITTGTRQTNQKKDNSNPKIRQNFSEKALLHETYDEIYQTN